jgi:hypothetical protein
MIQVRPGGPRPDPARGALEMMRSLTERAFGSGHIRFEPDGQFMP